jgi:hypothetical protein
MKNVLSRSLMASLIVFLSAAVGFAGDSATLAISCSIPAIPGVNVPLVEEKSLRTPADIPQETAEEPQKETPQPMLVQDDTKEEQVTSTGQQTLVAVKTIYSR